MLKFYAVSVFYILSVIASFLFTDTPLLFYLLSALTLVFIFTIVLGVSIIRLRFFIPSINAVPSQKKKIALTFDDGPHATNTPLLLNLLKKNKAKASFFLIGKNIEQQAELVKRVIHEGHTIGNHSYTHANTFPMKSTKEIAAEIQQTQVLIETISGKKNVYFRPPYGVTNPAIASAVTQSNLLTIGWNIRSFDTVSKNKERTLQQILSQIKGGDIILLHDHTAISYWLTEEIINFAKKENFDLVTIDELLNSKP